MHANDVLCLSSLPAINDQHTMIAHAIRKIRMKAVSGRPGMQQVDPMQNTLRGLVRACTRHFHGPSKRLHQRCSAEHDSFCSDTFDGLAIS